MFQLTPYEIEAMGAFAGNYAWTVALVGMMVREFRLGMRAPWPTWATPRRFRKDGDA